MYYIQSYGGYIHQLKYTNGHTYGDHTHLLANKYEFNRSKTFAVDSSTFDHLKKSNVKNELPKTTGGNRLTEKMIPGYNGWCIQRQLSFFYLHKITKSVLNTSKATFRRENSSSPIRTK